jgi:FeS assembly SUF system protein
MFDSLKQKIGNLSHRETHNSVASIVERDFDPQALRQDIVNAIKTVYDPEIPVNVYDLGLIYDIAINANRQVSIQMTLTAPACPVAGILPGQVGAVVENVEGVSEATVELVWDPPWSQERISEEAQLTLGLL